MANLNDVKEKVAEITLRDGVKRPIRYTLNALAELEDKYGSVDAAFEALDKGSVKAVRFILWAGLISDSPELTEQHVGNLIDVQYLQDLIGTLGTSLENGLPRPEALPDGVQDPNQ